MNMHMYARTYIVCCADFFKPHCLSSPQDQEPSPGLSAMAEQYTSPWVPHLHPAGRHQDDHRTTQGVPSLHGGFSARAQ